MSQRYPVDTRRLLAELAARGATIVAVRRTDEVSVSHPDLPRRVRVKGTRKDAARVLVSALRCLDRRPALHPVGRTG